MDAEKEKSKVEFRLIAAKDLNNLALSYKQIVVLLEGLYHYRNLLKKAIANTGNLQSTKFYEVKINDINTLFEYLENGIDYNFENAKNKCINKRKKDIEDTGMETMAWLASK